MKIFVVGSGGWGTAAAVLLDDNHHDVTLWSFFDEEAESLRCNRENKKFLPGVILADTIKITTDLSQVAQAEIIVFATPSFAVSKTAKSLKPYVNTKQTVILLSKGLDRENDYSLFYHTLEKELGTDIPICVLTGPSHAEEVARKVPTAVVAASQRREAAELTQDVFMNEYFRVYTTPDIIGAELGGALKNVIALAAGICDGMGLGDNTKAALMTRGIAEMARVGIKLGGESETFAGLSGLGDMIVTCTSMHSRNRRAGILIGQGKSAEDAIKEVGAVVEGYYAAEAAWAMAEKTGVEMPISQAIYKVLYQGLDPKSAIRDLMTRGKKHETEEIWMKHIDWRKS